ncbi:MAG: hypothetical protein JWO60_707 [Frankiales bacterium]|nr:hypothetical protein [Frankiales bacterium]
MTTADVAGFAARLREHGHACGPFSPLMQALLTGAADDLGQGGPVHDLLAPLADDPPGSVPGLRFAGALHRLVLERRAPLLALHYPSVGGTAPLEGLWEAVRSTVEEHAEALHPLVRRPVQTNEVGRSAVLLGGLALLTAVDRLPVRLLEVGASAGLNLRADAYALRVHGAVRGRQGSPVVLDEPWAGKLPPDVPVEVVERRGCDPDPLDPRATEDRLTLTSYVWADQVDRFTRLRGALAVAQEVEATVERAGATDFLGRHLGEVTPGRRTVVWQSVVRQYLTAQEREGVERVLEAAGERATVDAPLAHLTLEPARGTHELDRFEVRLRTWPGGGEELLAGAAGHGPPVVWRPRPV